MQEFSTGVVSVLYAFVEIILNMALKDLIIMHNQTIIPILNAYGIFHITVHSQQPPPIPIPPPAAPAVNT